MQKPDIGFLISGIAKTDNKLYTALGRLDNAIKQIIDFATANVPGATVTGDNTYVLTATGTLGIQSDICLRLPILSDKLATSVRLDLKSAPLGAAFKVSIYQSIDLINPWMKLTLLASNTQLNASTADIAGAIKLKAGYYLRVDITQVGSTNPGADMTVTITA